MTVFRMLTLLCVAIFFGEVAVMHMLEHMAIRDQTVEAFVDSAALLVIVFPVLYFSVLRTLVLNQSKLEQGIKVRTVDIEKAKAELEGTIGKLKSRQEEMILLGEMGSFFQSCRDIEEAMAVAEVELARLFPDMAGALYLMNPSRNMLERRALWGEATDIADHFSSADCWALRRSKPHVTLKANTMLACNHAFANEADWRICLPLVAQGDVLGTLCLASQNSLPEKAAGSPDIDPERMQFFLAVGENLALAIANLRLQEKLSYQALRDPLTGLFNRRYLLETLDRELDRAASLNEPLSVVMFDVDHFKQFNDRYGHAAGDAVLAKIGVRLLEWTRGKDIPVRFGGEEFTIVLPDTSPEEAFMRIDDLRRGIEALAFDHEGDSLGCITISAGIASYPLHGHDRATLIEHADQALFRSKREGRNRATLHSDDAAAPDSEASAPPPSRAA